MGNRYRLKDFGRSTLAAPIDAVAVSLNVQPGHGDRFPVGDSVGHGVIVLKDGAGNTEKIRYDTRASGADVLSTLVRGYEGSTARPWSTGAAIELYPLATKLEQAVADRGEHEAAADPHPQYPLASEVATALQNRSYTYAITAGTSTAYTVDLTPNLGAYQGGQEVDVAFHSACGANPTINIDGLGAEPLYRLQLGVYVALTAGEIPAGHRSRITRRDAVPGWVVRDIEPIWNNVRNKPQHNSWVAADANPYIVGGLTWRHYGNAHSIFDASSGVAPDGSGGHSSTTPDVGWNPTYPTLMGWNGTNTYGVRVDSARAADTAGSATNATNAGYAANAGNGLASVGRYSTGVVNISGANCIRKYIRLTLTNGVFMDIQVETQAQGAWYD